MRKLPTVPAPDGFDNDVALRALLATLPTVDAPETFEADVERRIANIPGPRHRFSRVMWWVVGMGLVCVVGLFVGIEQVRPTPVEVVAIPAPQSSVDLERLPPVAVEQDMRWTDEPPMMPRKHRRWPKVVTGY